MAGRTAVLVPVVAALLAGWVYQAFLLPPPPRLCGSPGSPIVTSPRVKLHDGRHLAYREWGVPREAARHRIVLVHGFNSCKDFSLNASQELVEELGAYIVTFDRAGYGESDPDPRRTISSAAMDIQELADQLGLGARFYVIGVSMGGYSAWACIKHIPHRLAGVALVAPVVNYWWPSLPAKLTREAFGMQQPSDQRAFWVAHHAPWLLHGYMTQKLVTPSKIIASHPDVFPRHDKEILQMLAANPPQSESKATQQGVHESLYRDLMVAFGKWEFEPMGLANPFPGGEGAVHIWQGGQDRLVPAAVHRHVAGKLPWVRYHECAECGHLLVLLRQWSDAVLGALLRQEGTVQSAA